MPPNKNDSIEVTGILNENEDDIDIEDVKQIYRRNKHPHQPIVWQIVFKHFISHSCALYGFYLAFTSAKLLTILLVFVNYQFGVLGDTAGAHRLWAHHSYKARWPLRLFLVYCQTITCHKEILVWVKYHRVHHKYTETDADPHNAQKGLFYSHIGWTIKKPTEEFDKKYKEINVSDLYEDSLVVFQYKYYIPLMVLICFVLPTVIPVYFWQETWKNAFFLNMLRYLINLHSFLSVNSFTHLYGFKPYNKFLEASENPFVSYVLGGEGWHNYHHVFPWDYKTSEFGNFNGNTSAAFIDFMAKLGLAYDLKTVSSHMIENKIKKMGDGSHSAWGTNNQSDSMY